MREILIQEYGLKKEKATVSIILPTYNRGYIIRKAIDSIRSQTFQDYELIIVDDHSSDDTKDVVSKYKDISIKYIYLEENHGGGYARNIGMKYSKGDILSFMDSDCVWDEKFLEISLKYILSDYDLTFCRYQLIELDGRVSITPIVEWEKINTLEKLIHFELEKNVFGTPLICMKRRIWDECGGFDESQKRYQDWEYFFRIILTQKYKVYFIDKILMKSYQQKNSLSLQHRDIKVESLIRIFSKNVKSYRTLDIYDEALEKLQKNTVRYCTFETVLKKVLISILQEDVPEESADKVDVNENSYSYIFPYHLFNKDSKVLIYGKMDVGICLSHQAKKYGDVEIVDVLDENSKKIPFKISKSNVWSTMDSIKAHVFDFILVAADDLSSAYRIKADLVRSGISEDKIKWDGSMCHREDTFRKCLELIRFFPI